MGRLSLKRECALALIGAVACCPTAHAAEAQFAPNYSGSQIMLYVSWSFSAKGTRPDAFGLRYERSAPASSDPGTHFTAPLAHHSLVDLKFARGAAPLMQFGPRVTWDISRGRLGPTNALNRWQVPVPATAAALGFWAP